ncbi:MAG: NUDIX hydrolase [Acidimicrobiia bacterium]
MMPTETLAFGEPLRHLMARNLAALDVQSATGGRAAAVVMAIVPAGDQAAFILTRRPSHLSNHPGQFALPGGRIETGETAEQAALRELEEEVGVSLSDDCILGRMDDYVTRSGFVITPVVAWAGWVDPIPNPEEVAEVYEIPLSVLDRDDAPRLITIPESDRPVIQMPMLDNHIHAPTAAVLYQFREVALRGLQTRVAHFEQPVWAWR